MKQKIFTLVLMLAMVFVASSAWAQTYNVKSVYAGGTYPYRITGVAVNGAATVTVPILPSGASVDNLTPDSYVGATSDQTITFDVEYATNATSGDIVVRIQENGGCSNYVTLSITVTTPVLTLSIATTDITCQSVNNHPADGNDGTVGQTNTVTYTFALSSLIGLESYSYTYAVSANAQLGISASSISKTNVTSQTVGFNTTEGAATDVQATISAGTFKMDAAHGGATYNITINGLDDGTGTQTAISAVYALPTIGGFN